MLVAYVDYINTLLYIFHAAPSHRRLRVFLVSLCDDVITSSALHPIYRMLLAVWSH